MPNNNCKSNDLVSDGNCISLVSNAISESGVNSKVERYEVSHVLERSINDEEVCERTLGCRAGAGVGAAVSFPTEL